MEKPDGARIEAKEVVNLNESERKTVTEIYDTIKFIMEHSGELNGFNVFIVKGDKKVATICEMPDEPWMRDAMASKLKHILSELKPDFIVTAAEAWAIARTPATWTGERPSEAKDRQEICAFTFEASDGRRGVQTIPMLRDADKKVHLPDSVLTFAAKSGGPSGRLDNLLGDVTTVEGEK